MTQSNDTLLTIAVAPPAVRPWHNPVYRQIGYQVVMIVALVAGFAFIASNVATNLAKSNKTLGFGFLGQTAGFDISQTLVSYSNLSSYGRVFLVGLLNTLLVAVVGIIFATILGFLVGMARLSANWLVRQMATAYVA